MSEYESYSHHGHTTFVRSDLKGKHRSVCLCHSCVGFPGCEIAKEVYENCVKHGIVSPVWECPQFIEKTE